MIDHGQILSVAAFAVGGRLLARDAKGDWTRIDDSACLVANELGMRATPATFADRACRVTLARRLATLLVDQVAGAALDSLGAALQLTAPLSRTVKPEFVSFSGGVAEYVFGHEIADHGDIAQLLAEEVVKQLRGRIAVPVVEPMERIRATVIGASQFTVQVSGKTIYLPAAAVLPVHNVPVVHLGLDLSQEIVPADIVAALGRKADLLGLEPHARLAVAFAWNGEPDHSRLLAMARALMQFAAPSGRRGEPLLLMIDGDVGASLGRILHDEVGVDGPIVSVDGIKLRELDFVDVGELLTPQGVVPVVIKSLLFPV